MNNEPKAGMSIDPELLAAYIDQRLPSEERAAVEAQLANDPDSYALLVETMKAHDALDPVTVRVTKTDRRWRTTAATLAAIAAALVLAVWIQPEWFRRFIDRPDPLIARLVDAVGPERYLDARLSGGFNYGPLRSVNRSAGDPSQQNLAVLAAAGELQQRAQRDPSVENRHAWAIAQVLLLRSDEAINILEAIRDEGRASAEALADLSAAYASRARATGQRDDWPRSLESAEAALRLNPKLPEAYFNKAVALEELGQLRQALETWDALIALEPNDAWRGDVQSRRDALRLRM
jgi:tetratricopeptide (TPR) repeat protein